MRTIRNVAIVGSGVSGIGCAWALRDAGIKIDLYEAADRAGGHANSVPFRGNGLECQVDTGFIVLNDENYANFNKFLRQIGIDTVPTNMSLSVSRNKGTFEWSSTSLRGFLSQISNIMSLSFWRMAFDVLRFNYFATDILSEHEKFNERKETLFTPPSESSSLEPIGSYLDRKGYSTQFKTDYLVPMVAAPWSIAPEEFSRNFPALTLIRFMWNHRLLDTINTNLQWKTIAHGSKSYVDQFTRMFNHNNNHRLFLNTPVTRISREQNGTTRLFTSSNNPLGTYDHIILAVHANQALRILAESATDAEKSILQHFQTRRNTCVLHSDESLMPLRETTHASWNILIHDQAAQQACITFDMNKLQHIPSPGQRGSPGRVLVSMNPLHAPAEATVQARHVYEHPLLTCASVAAASHLPLINGAQGVSFAGAWMGYGFHEDGFVAGLKAGNDVLREAGLEEVEVLETENLRGEVPVLSCWDGVVRVVLGLVQALVVVLDTGKKLA